MLILDNKNRKDYYDGIVSTTGVDKTIVYERALKELEDGKTIPKPFQRSGLWNDKNMLIQHFSYIKKTTYNNATDFIVGFCGNLYLGFKMYSKKQDIGIGNEEILVDITYDVEEFKKHFEPRWSFVDFDEFVKHVKNYDSTDIHREINSPLFVWDNNSVMSRRSDMFVVNPMLKDYQFYKVFDSFTAFQEIQMYISGVLGVGENPIVEISDKDKITQHGFDPKWSFRKEPKEKK